MPLININNPYIDSTTMVSDIMPQILQLYTRFNHVNVALSYKATLAAMTKWVSSTRYPSPVGQPKECPLNL